MRIITVAGARPNFIKIAPLIPALEQAGHEVRLAHTGQHYDTQMSDVFFDDLSIPRPDWFLGVGSGTHAVQTGKALIALEELFSREKPDAIVVVGDVNSTLAAALAAAKLRLPVVHVEAGLRSFDMAMPEEVNRLVTDQLSSLCLTSTREAVDNLHAEGIEPRRVRFVGNVMAESLLRNLEAVEARSPHVAFGLEEGGYVLVTIHRPENTDEPTHLEAVVTALRSIGLPVLIPAHPRTRPLLERTVAGDDAVHVVDPVGYLDMLALQRAAALVVTDSGGLQEESCLLGTPCVTVRRNTERAVTIEVGANRLATAEPGAITAACEEALASDRDWPMPEYWDAEVSRRICEALDEGIPALRGL